MIRKLFYGILVCVFVIGCNNNKIERPKKPNNLIKKEEMVNILYDMAIMTAAKGAQMRIIEKHGVAPEHLIFKKYDIDSMQFVLSNEYYSYDIDKYQGIYEKVREKLNAVKAQEDSLIKKENEERRKVLNKKETDSTAGKEVNRLSPLKSTDTLQ